MLNNIKLINYLKKATIYEVNLRQYTKEGSIISFQKHLPRLKEMGVDILWFMPIHPIGIKNRKGSLGSYYCSSNFFELNPEYGTKDDFKNLVSEIHLLGMKIIIDWVANHAAWDNNWTTTNPDFFLRNEQGEFLSPYDWTDVIQIDHNNEAAHDAMRSAMCHWVEEYDIDGFRADLAHLTPLRFWIKARHLTEKIKPDLIWLAETEEPEYYQAFDIFYAWKWMHKTESFFKDNLEVKNLVELLKEQLQSYPDRALQMFFTTNHDENSWNGTEFEKYGVHAKALSVFSFIYPHSVPLIYCGQEIPNHKRLHFFDKDEIIWDEELQLQSFYQTLIFNRKRFATNDSIEYIFSEKKLLAFRRGNGIGSVIVFLNLDNEIIHFNYNMGNEAGIYKNIFLSSSEKIDAVLEINLKPGDYLVLEKID